MPFTSYNFNNTNQNKLMLLFLKKVTLVKNQIVIIVKETKQYM